MTVATPNAEHPQDLDLQITRIKPRTSAGGTWVSGTIDDEFRFDALVFAEHAQTQEYELNGSRISKLWIATIKDRKTTFNFDRGLDIPARCSRTQGVVEFLCEGLADLIYAN